MHYRQSVTIMGCLAFLTTVYSQESPKEQFYCSTNTCKRCEFPLRCPTDMAMYSTMAECNLDCPRTPTCYFCDSKKQVCTPGYDYGCQHRDINTMQFKTQKECDSACMKKGDIQFTEGDRMSDVNGGAAGRLTMALILPILLSTHLLQGWIFQ